MDVPSDDVLSRYASEGFVVVPDMFTRAECRAFLERNRAYYALGQWSGLDTHTRDDCFDDIITHPTLLAWARALLGGPVACAQTLVFAKPPGNKGIALHQESYYIATDPPELLTCWVALEDAHEDNGGLTLVPGSHRRGLLAVREPANPDEHIAMREPFTYHDRDGRRWEETIIAGEIPMVAPDACVTPTVAAGSVIFFDGRTIHGSSRNRSADASRHAFSAHFVRRGTWIYRVDIAHARAL